MSPMIICGMERIHTTSEKCDAARAEDECARLRNQLEQLMEAAEPFLDHACTCAALVDQGSICAVCLLRERFDAWRIKAVRCTCSEFRRAIGDYLIGDHLNTCPMSIERNNAVTARTGVDMTPEDHDRAVELITSALRRADGRVSVFLPATKETVVLRDDSPDQATPRFAIQFLDASNQPVGRLSFIYDSTTAVLGFLRLVGYAAVFESLRPHEEVES